MEPNLPDFFVTPTTTQLFMFSAITWNRHPIHFNRDQATLEGFPNIVVHRGLLGNLLTRALTKWTGDPATIKRVSWKVLQSAFPGEELKITGQITAETQSPSSRKIECNLLIQNPAGASIATGTATLEV